ncbi:MAG: HD domain-containing protein [Patescibacteria group bacterium]
MKNEIRRKIEEYAKLMKWTPGDLYWKHAFMVRKFALMLQKEVGGDKDIIEVSALLHDIGKAKLLASGHEKISGELAEQFLRKIDFDESQISKIIECIKYENFDSVEAKILRSADSMALIMDAEGQKWYFTKVLGNDKEKILNEIEKSFSEIEFDTGKKFIKDAYQKLVNKYKSAVGCRG